MKDYELVVLLHPDLEIDLEKPLKKIEKLISDYKGKITAQDVWGKRKLAYPIKKEDFAVYVYFELSLPKDAVRKLDNGLNLSDEVLRHLITNPVPKPEPEEDEDSDNEDAKPKATTKTAKQAKQDEED